MVEGLKDLKNALKVFQQTIVRTRFYKTLIAVMDWMEECLEDLSSRRRGGQG